MLYDALDDTKKAYFKPVIDEMAADAEDLGLGENGAYALAWIKLWVENYNEQTDDGPICNTLVSDSATDQAGLLVYSKLRSVEESAGVSLNNIKVAAYQTATKASAVTVTAITFCYKQQPASVDCMHSSST